MSRADEISNWLALKRWLQAYKRTPQRPSQELEMEQGECREDVLRAVLAGEWVDGEPGQRGQDRDQREADPLVATQRWA